MSHKNKNNKSRLWNDQKDKRIRGSRKRQKLRDMETPATNKWDKFVDEWIKNNET